MEFITEPVGLDVEYPRFSWIPVSNKRGAEQSAYRILVSNDPGKIEDLEGDLWDSGKVVSSETIHILYEGPALKSVEDYYWRVQIWDELGEASEWSHIQHFSTGLIHQDEWIGKWVSHPDSSVSAPLVRTEFEIGKPVKKATAFVTGAGYYELYLNGKKVGNHVLDPALTDFRKRILYETFDVTDLLRSGENGIGMWLGNGALRVRDTNDRWTWHRMDNQFGNPMGRLQIHIRFEDGSEEVLMTDKGWKTSLSPLSYNNVYGGEDYDARLEQRGWSEPGFD
ncbi:MAG: alpha-L-rhamnosidase, partial [Bacteroidetes bacterium]|nr:alpha-L-rhamnosidase [Bacteroidota bacterium]